MMLDELIENIKLFAGIVNEVGVNVESILLSASPKMVSF
jgi:hypothetical protein